MNLDGSGSAKIFGRTDLAVESRELAGGKGSAPIPGVLEDVVQEDGIKITRLDVENEAPLRKSAE